MPLPLPLLKMPIRGARHAWLVVAVALSALLIVPALATAADVAPPSVSFTTLGSFKATRTNIDMTVTDDVAVDRIEYTYYLLHAPAVPVGSGTDSTPPYQLDIDSMRQYGTTEVGQYFTAINVTVTAYDTSGKSTQTTNTFFVDEQPPGQVPQIMTGSSAVGPAAWINSRTSFSATWTYMGPTYDPAGIDYSFCVTAGISCTDGVVAPLTSTGIVQNTINWMTGTVGGLSLVEDGTTRYRACVLTTDRVGNTTGNPKCQTTGTLVDATPPPPVLEVRDANWDTAADIDATKYYRIFANWDAVTDTTGASVRSGLAGYEYCIGLSTPCAGEVQPWTHTNSTSFADVEFWGNEGATVYACVRVLDAAGNASTGTCSDGVLIDTSQPNAIHTVYDGATPGVDIAWIGGDEVTANWTTVTDSGSGVANYELCVSRDAACAANMVMLPSSAGITVDGTTATARRTGSLSEETLYRTCVRAVDRAANGGSLRCSNGFRFDATAPSGPGGSLDGLIGGDLSVSGDHTRIDARWNAAGDVGGSGVVRYEVCVSSSTQCAGTIARGWSSTGVSSGGAGLSASVTGLDLTDSHWFTCIRGIDFVGNVGGAGCTSGVTIDTVAPTGSSITVDTHPTTAWSTMRSLGGSIELYTDSSLIAGYSLVIDQSATTVPAQNINHHTRSLSEPDMPLGASYVHVRAVDEGGNWSSTNHYGPINIDYDGAGSSVALDSPSHVASAGIDTFSNDRTIDLELTAQNDANAPIVGYDVEWSEYLTPAGSPSRNVDIDGASQTTTSPELSSGAWYALVHVQDAAGNWSTTQNAGPFLIDITPGGTGAIASSSHDATYKTDPSVTLQLTTPIDPGTRPSGIVGYSVVWDRSPNTTGTTAASGTNIADITSPDLDAGTWYAHIRTFDGAGNWSTDTLHGGPYRIDGAPIAGTVMSPSHTHVWSSDTSIEVTLADFFDPSGIDGYSVEWDESPATVGSTVANLDGDATTATSPPRVSGAWYAHVRAVDASGTWSTTVHAGPFAVDADAPTAGTVTSPSHSAAASLDATVDLEFAGFVEVTSSLAAFEVTWDASATSVPATGTPRVVGSSITSPSLAPGTWYAHVRAVDEVGNTSEVVHAGPFTITAPPKDPAPTNPAPTDPTPVVPPVIVQPVVDRSVGTARADRFRGSARADLFRGFAGNDVFSGLAGNDTFFGGAGNDTADGGPGNDRLSGEAGNDRLTGKAGRDTLLGGPGNDVLNAADGKPRDIVDCGPGAKDRAIVDRGDIVRRCERVTRR